MNLLCKFTQTLNSFLWGQIARKFLSPCSPIIRRSWVTSSSELTQNCPLGKLFAKVNNFKDPGFFDDSWDGSQNDHILQV